MSAFKTCTLLAAILSISLFTSAQTAAPASPAPQANNNSEASPVAQHIERNIRARFKIPPEVKIEVSAFRPAEFPGYDAVTVTLVNGTRRSPYEFYVSKDGKTLAQLNKMDISQDPFDASGRPSRGAQDAKVTVLVYDDFQCPYCARGYKTLFNEILPEYKDKIRVVYKDFPLSEIHPWAVHAAVDANCLFAQSNDAYWDFADYVHSSQGEIKGENRPIEDQYSMLDKSAESVGQKRNLDQPKLQACIKAQDSKDVLASEKYGETTLGIDATPTIFVNGQRLDGAVPAEDFRPVLDAALRDVGVAPPAHAATNAVVKPDANAIRNATQGLAPPSSSASQAQKPDTKPASDPPKPQ